jgi:uracil-DNA glycosylase family 4
LAEFLGGLREKYPDYYNAPVPAFGDPEPRLLIVGLAPGMHGANATGRPFTGDFAGILLYETLHELGLASAPQSVSEDDGLQLMGCRITNAVKCLPPENKPVGAEINTCNRFLSAELTNLRPAAVVLALGGIAHRAVVKAEAGRQKDFPFGHGAVGELPSGRQLISSYHCSRYNTQTKRLTAAMFKQVVAQARDLATQ